MREYVRKSNTQVLLRASFASCLGVGLERVLNEDALGSRNY